MQFFITFPRLSAITVTSPVQLDVNLVLITMEHRGFAFDARSLVSFLNRVVWRKTTKHAIILDLLHNRILDSPVCVC